MTLSPERLRALPDLNARLSAAFASMFDDDTLAAERVVVTPYVSPDGNVRVIANMSGPQADALIRDNLD